MSGESPTAGIISNCSTPALVGLLARFDINFVQGFDVFGDECDGHNEEMFFARRGQPVDACP